MKNKITGLLVLATAIASTNSEARLFTLNKEKAKIGITSVEPLTKHSLRNFASLRGDEQQDPPEEALPTRQGHARVTFYKISSLSKDGNINFDASEVCNYWVEAPVFELDQDDYNKLFRVPGFKCNIEFEGMNSQEFESYPSMWIDSMSTPRKTFDIFSSWNPSGEGEFPNASNFDSNHASTSNLGLIDLSISADGFDKLSL